MIYYVEDDASIRNLVIYTLKSVGYEAEGFDSSVPFLSRMKEKRPELILLDIMLPGESGLDILKKLKSSPAAMQIPVILLTALDQEDDIVTGLDLGADDYIAKPFGIMELIARVKAVLRRTAQSRTGGKVTLGAVSVDRDGRVVTVNGAERALTLKEYQLLELLMSRPDHVFERNEILDSVWSKDYFGGNHTLDAHIQTLRHKLGLAGGQIQTVYGYGYKIAKAGESGT